MYMGDEDGNPDKAGLHPAIPIIEKKLMMPCIFLRFFTDDIYNIVDFRF